jgi:hypothetical protein
MLEDSPLSTAREKLGATRSLHARDTWCSVIDILPLLRDELATAQD